MTKAILTCLMVSIFSLTQSNAQNWTELPIPLGGNTYSCDKSGPNLYGTLSAGGFAKSIDYGATWTSDTAGIPKGTPILLTVTSSGKILMGKMDIGGINGNFPVYQSVNEGVSWTAIPGINAVSGGLVSGPSEKVLLIPSYDGTSTMKVSSNGGQIWSNTSIVAKSAAFDSNGKIYVIHYNSSMGASQLVSNTTNDSTFAPVSGANIDTYSDKITIGPDNTIYVIGGSVKPKISSNGGSSFSDMDSAFSSIWVDANNNIYATKGTSILYRQEHGTSTWNNVSAGLSLGVSGFYFKANGDVYITSGLKLLKYKSSGSTSTQEIQTTSNQEILLYPQPVNDILHIGNLSEEIKAVDILNLNGQLIWSGNPTHNSIRCTEFSEGIYMLNAIAVSGNLYRQKFIVTRQ